MPCVGADARDGGLLDLGEDVGEEVGAGAGERFVSRDGVVGECTVWFAEDAEVVEVVVFGWGAEDGDEGAFPLELGAEVVDLGDRGGGGGDGEDQGWGEVGFGGDVGGLVDVVGVEFEGGGDRGGDRICA